MTIKRLLDISVSAAVLLLLSPFMIAVGLLVKLSDGGPILYSGDRVGRIRVPFKMHWFWTMVPNADKIGDPSLKCREPTQNAAGAKRPAKRCTEGGFMVAQYSRSPRRAGD